MNKKEMAAIERAITCLMGDDFDQGIEILYNLLGLSYLEPFKAGETISLFGAAKEEQQFEYKPKVKKITPKIEQQLREMCYASAKGKPYNLKLLIRLGNEYPEDFRRIADEERARAQSEVNPFAFRG